MQLNDIALRHAIIATARDQLPTPAYRLKMDPLESTCPVPFPEFESKLAVQSRLREAAKAHHLTKIRKMGDGGL